MRKKLPKKIFKKKHGVGRRYFWLSLFLVILLIGFFGGRLGHRSYREWEKRGEDRAVVELVEEKNRILEEILKIYGGHVDLGSEDLEAMLMVIEEGILRLEKIKIDKGEEKVKALLEEDLKVSRELLEELELLVEYLLKIQPCYKRFEASILNLLAKDAGMILVTENYLEDKRKSAEVDFEVCGKIEAGKYEDAQVKFLVILKDYVEFLKKAGGVTSWGQESYLRIVGEYREKLGEEMNNFEKMIEFNNLSFFKDGVGEKERFDEEILSNLKLKTKN